MTHCEFSVGLTVLCYIEGCFFCYLVGPLPPPLAGMALMELMSQTAPFTRMSEHVNAAAQSQ